MKKVLACAVIAFIALSVVFLPACDGQSAHSSMSKYNIEEKIWETSVPDFSNNEAVRSFSPELDPGFELGDIAESPDGTVYCVALKLVPQAQFAEVVKITKYNREKNQTETIFTFDSDTVWVNELAAAADSLFWVNRVRRDNEPQQKIERYDTKTGVVSEIKRFDHDTAILLSSGGNYLTWYENNEQGSHSLFVLDATAMEIRMISETISTKQYPHMQALYGRASVQENVVTFMEETPDLNIVIYDLDHDIRLYTFSHEQSGIVSNPQANREYLAWEETETIGSPDRKYYLLEYKRGKLYDLNVSSVAENPFSWHLLKDAIVVNNRVNNQEIDKSQLIFMDLLQDKTHILADNDELLSFCNVVDGDTLIMNGRSSHDAYNKDIYIIYEVDLFG